MKTSISKGTHTPTWNEELKLPVTMPTLSDTITFQLYDSRTVGFDALISTRYLKFSDVLAKANYVILSHSLSLFQLFVTLSLAEHWTILGELLWKPLRCSTISN